MSEQAEPSRSTPPSSQFVLALAVLAGSAAGWVGHGHWERHGARVVVHTTAIELPSPTFSPTGSEACDTEPRRLLAVHGSARYSWHHEELLVRDFFQGERGGVFLDVGAYPFRNASNTYYLEQALNWRGIAIDAQEQFRRGYEENRPRTRYFTYYVSDHTGERADLHVSPLNDALASGTAARAALDGEATEQIEVETITLDALLDREGVESIDFLTMDIESAEPAALRGFDIERFGPRLVCIEDRDPEVRAFVVDYLRAHGYVEHQLWSRLDDHNAYFIPRDLLAGAESRAAWTRGVEHAGD